MNNLIKRLSCLFSLGLFLWVLPQVSNATVYTLTVSNPSAASVGISNTTASNTLNPSSATSIKFNVNGGEAPTLTATKQGYSCTVTPLPIPVMTASRTATVACLPDPYTVTVANPSLALVRIVGSTATNSSATSSLQSVIFNVKYNNKITLTATKLGHVCVVKDSDLPVTLTAVAGDMNATVSCTPNTLKLTVVNTQLATVTMTGSTATSPGSPTGLASAAFYARYNDNVEFRAAKSGYGCTATPPTLLVKAVATVAVKCLPKPHTVTVTNPSLALVRIVGSTATNSSATSSLESVIFNVKYNNKITLTATKLGHVCVVKASDLPVTLTSVAGDMNATVSCTPNTLKLTVVNTQLATVTMTGSTVVSPVSTSSASAAFYARYNDAVTFSATKQGYVCSTTPVGLSVKVPTSVVVRCALIPTYKVSGTVIGLETGKSIVLQNNGSNNLTVTNPVASFSFPPQRSNTGYNVTVLTQPVGQTCLIVNGLGTIATSNITDVVVICRTNDPSLIWDSGQWDNTTWN